MYLVDVFTFLSYFLPIFINFVFNLEELFTGICLILSTDIYQPLGLCRYNGRLGFSENTIQYTI